MKFTVSKKDSYALAQVEGSLELGRHEKLKEDLLHAAQQHGLSLILDMGKVSFIDSACLGVLVGCARKLKAEGGDIRLCRLNDEVSSIFGITRLDKVFKIYPSLAEAEASLHP